ncbi:MAG TPA: hypothetical protein VGA85_03610 [Dehalococcoidales bacterium]
MERAKLGGIFSIASGAFGFLYLGFALLGVFIFNSIFNPESSLFLAGEIPPEEFSDAMSFMTIYCIAIGVFYGLLGLLGIIGGIYALKRKYWGLALAGSIAGSITFFPCGIVAVIFTAMAKPEFDMPTTN